MRQAKKGDQWYFGMKAYIGTDLRAIAHTVVATHVSTPDITQLKQPLHGDESVVDGYQAYDSTENVE